MRPWFSTCLPPIAVGGLLVLFAALLAGCVTPVTTRSLLVEMTDLRGLAEFPDPPYTCRQFSSYDRASSSPDEAESWFANGDYNKFLGVEERPGRKEYVMMDADGPGAIVRIWSANPKGTLRVYLDHRPTPVLEAPMADLLGGKAAGIPDPIAHQRSRGWNCYLPIPYARHCKVTSDQDGFYYHVNYRTYPPGTPVTSFKAADLQKLTHKVAQAATQLSAARENSLALTERLPAGCSRTTYLGGLELGPGQAIPKAITLAGPAGLFGLTAKVEAPDRDLALRQLLLTIEFDGEQTVACPLGDFFGGGPGLNAYASLPLGVDPDGQMWCNWVMPFAESARLQICNLGATPARVWLSVTCGPYKWTDRSMYFHAGWRVARDVPTRPFQDWNYLSARGKGVFAGVAFSLANPTRKWWGEGDEKIYVDREAFPSHFGTGTEDYYGYAWGSPERFTHAYHNQPRCDGPGNYGRTAVNRWHILDRIPFSKHFRFDMELWHWWEGNIPEMSVVAYWYARPGATSNRHRPSADDLSLAVLPPYVAPRVAGALEGEEMRVLEKTGEATPQEIDGCSNDSHLWWRPAGPGDRLVLAFPAPAAGRYRVWGRFVKARDYGIAQLSIGGAKAGEAIDFYNKSVTAAPEQLLGEFDLLAGNNRLTVEMVGTNENAEPKKYMFGLDYLRLEGVE